MLVESDMIISGFISKIINEIVDIPWRKIKSAIKKADENRKNENQSMETRIFQVTIDAINVLTFGKYENKEVLYDVAERIIKGVINDKKISVNAVNIGLKMLVSQVTDEMCKDFMQVLCQEICKDESDILYKEIVLVQQKQLTTEMYKGFEESVQNQNNVLEKLDGVGVDIKYIRERVDSKTGCKEEQNSKVYIKNRAEDYARKWDKNVFLNNFDEEDENAGTEIKLRDLYKETCLPHYIWKKNTSASDKLKGLLKKYIIYNDEKKMLLILGQAGIGKSTLITWIMANFVERKDQILVYQFASDLSNIDWQGKGILNEILDTLGLVYGDLENKILILDGFDEIHIDGSRERVLDKLNQELKSINLLTKFSMIITCRENYVKQSNFSKVDYIILQEWDEKQIRQFCDIYMNLDAMDNLDYKNNKENMEGKISKIIEKKEIFGIPLILYMVLALNIDIEKSSSVVDIYDQVFSLKSGGIYDRCYETEHRINSPELKEHIHHISQKIAFWIFENGDDKAIIPQEEFEAICDNEMNSFGQKGSDIKSDVLIGNYFKAIRHCDAIGTDELQFIHRSIYEYFTTVYFFETICKLCSKEKVAGRLGVLLKRGNLSVQILKLIKCKIDNWKNGNLQVVIREAFQIMLRDGMTYYIGKPVLNVMDREINVFVNMLEVVHLWDESLEKFGNNIARYLRYNNHRTSLNLIGVNLCKADLSGVNLIGANLNRAKLCEANLSKANLTGANLSGADLSSADLTEADLKSVNLEKTNLSGADMSETDLRGADLTEANLSGTNLFLAHIRGANIISACLDFATIGESQIDILYNNNDLSKSYVYDYEIHSHVSYEDYFDRRGIKKY